MNLQLLTPLESLRPRTIRKILVDTAQGLLCILPRHIDVVTLVLPGIVTAVGESVEHFAVNEGVLVKQGDQLILSAQEIVEGDLQSLVSAVSAGHRRVEEREKRTRSALSRLEVELMRRFKESRS